MSKDPDRLAQNIARVSMIARVTAVALAAGVLGLASPVAAADPRVSIGIVAKDGSGIVPTLLAEDKALQRKHGIEVEAKPFPSVTAVWTAFGAGQFDILIGGPAGFVGLAEQGVPIHLMSTYAISSAQIFGRGKKIESAADLKGKRVTAVVAGLWKLTEAQIKDKFGLSPGSGYELIPVPNLLAGVTQVLAGTADFAMGWEPDSSRVRSTYPDLRLVLTSEDLRPAGEPSYMQVLGSRNAVTPDTQKRLVAALNEMADKVKADPAAAEATFVRLSGAESGSFVAAVQSGRYGLVVRSLSASDKSIIASDILKTLPDGSKLPEGLLSR